MMRMHGLYIQFNKFMKERINTHWSEIKTVDKIRSRSLVLFISNCLFFFRYGWQLMFCQQKIQSTKMINTLFY